MLTALLKSALEFRQPWGGCAQVVVNYSASAGKAEEVADQIKSMGGDAITVKANTAKVITCSSAGTELAAA